MMNVPYEEWLDTLRSGAAKVGETLNANDLAGQLVRRGTALRKKYRRRKTAITLAIGFAGGVGVTLLAFGLAASVKRKGEKVHHAVELLHSEPEEPSEAPEEAEPEQEQA